eukprot:12932908-Ditylum_brightwellii.AAC.1
MHRSSISWLMATMCLGFGYINYEVSNLLDKDVYGPDPIPIPVVIDSNSDSGDPTEPIEDSLLSLISEIEDATFSYCEIQDIGNKVTFTLVYSRADVAAAKDHWSLPVVTVKTIFNSIRRRKDN